MLDGIPIALPALARAQKVLGRVQRAGLDERAGPDEPAEDGSVTAEQIGDELLVVARRAAASGVDAEAALRAAVRALEDRARKTEAVAGPGRALEGDRPAG